MKMYIAILDEFPDYMTPTLVGHSVLGAHLKFENDSDYPGWKYREHSKLREHMKHVYHELYNKEPIVEAIHAGLECGLFLDVISNDLDMIAIGPNMHDVHTPDEHLELDSAARVYSFLIETLKRMKEM